MIHIPDSFFPKDENGGLLCPRCRKAVAVCDCPVEERHEPGLDPSIFTPMISRDKKGRQGKTVTLVSGLPADEEFLKDCSRQLKVMTGGGGTFYLERGCGVIEVQGEHLTQAQKLLAEKGFNAKIRR